MQIWIYILKTDNFPSSSKRDTYTQKDSIYICIYTIFLAHTHKKIVYIYIYIYIYIYTIFLCVCAKNIVYIHIYILSFWVYVSLFDEEGKLSVFNIYIQICNVFGTSLYFSIYCVYIYYVYTFSIYILTSFSSLSTPAWLR